MKTHDMPLVPLDSSILQQMLSQLSDKKDHPVFLCIGTDRIIGDSLGPMVGSILLHRSHETLNVYGTLQEPLHALNIPERFSQIKKKHPDSAMIAVDASLGSFYDVGTIHIRPGCLHPGAGVSKTLPDIGDIAITGISAPESEQPYLSLQTARLSVIAAMADQISRCILQVCYQMQQVNCDTSSIPQDGSLHT